MLRGRFGSWTAMIVGWACSFVAGVVFAQPANQPATNVRRLTGQEISFVVPENAAGPFEFEATIEVDEKLRTAFGADNPIQWRPLAQQAPLKRSLPFALSGDTAPPLVMTLANAPTTAGSTSPAVILHAERGLLLEPRRLKIVVPKPRQIAAGVYRGEVVSRMKTLASDIEVDYVWPLVIRFEGRHLNGVRFRGRGDGIAQPANLPIGAPASLVVDLITVGESVDLGAGAVRMACRRGDGGANDVAEVLRLPLAAKLPPIDASIDVPLMRPWKNVQPFCTSNWSNQVLFVDVKQAATETVEGTRVVLQHVHVHLSSAFELGRWTADVEWDGCPGVRAEVDVVPGIRVFPELAMVGEKVRVQVVCDSTDAAEIDLTLTHSSGASLPFKAVRSNGGAATSTAKGVEFTAAVSAGSFGVYSIALSKTPQNDALSKPPAPGGFEVFFKEEHRLGAPFHLYIDSPLPWENDPTIYHDLKVERPMALRVEYSSQAVLEGLEAQLKAVSRRSKNRTELTRFRSDSDWQRAPKMSFSSSDKASKQQGTPGDGFETLAPYSFDAPAPDSAPAPAPGQSGKAATDADENGTAGSTPSKDATPANESPTPAGDASRTPAATLARWTAGGESPTSVGFDMRLEIAKGTPLAEHDLEMRLVVGGVGTDGRPRYRIIAVPFKAVVTSQWVTWWRWIWVGVSILAIAILVWVIVRFFNRRSMPQQLSPMLDDSPVVDLEDDGVRPMTRMPERSTKSGGPTASKSAEAGAAAADESDSWSSLAGLGDATGMLRPDDSSGEDSSSFRP